jgi:hypothetical protein
VPHVLYFFPPWGWLNIECQKSKNTEKGKIKRGATVREERKTDDKGKIETG